MKRKKYDLSDELCIKIVKKIVKFSEPDCEWPYSGFYCIKDHLDDPDDRSGWNILIWPKIEQMNGGKHDGDVTFVPFEIDISDMLDDWFQRKMPHVKFNSGYDDSAWPPEFERVPHLFIHFDYRELDIQVYFYAAPPRGKIAGKLMEVRQRQVFVSF